MQQRRHARQELDAIAAAGFFELGLRVAQCFELRRDARSEPLAGRAQPVVRLGLQQAFDGPIGQARIGEPLFAERAQLAQAGIAIGARIALTDANQGLDQRRVVARGSGVIAQQRLGLDVAGLCHGRVDPRLHGAVRTRERPRIQPSEREPDASTLATGEQIAGELQARGQELVQPGALEQLVEAELRVERRVLLALDRRQHALQVDLCLGARVESGTEGARQIPIRDRRAHALQVHGAPGFAQSARVLAVHFVGGARATAQSEDVREARRSGCELGRHLVGAQ